MGDFSEHVLFGFLTAFLVFYFTSDFLSLSVTESTASVLMVFVGSVFPDIDHKNSYVHRSVKALICITASAAVLLVPLQVNYRFLISVAVFLSVYLAISSLNIRHRGFAHSISFSLITSSLIVILSVLSLSSALPGIGFGIGFFSHLILDEELKLE